MCFLLRQGRRDGRLADELGVAEQLAHVDLARGVVSGVVRGDVEQVFARLGDLADLVLDVAVARVGLPAQLLDALVVALVYDDFRQSVLL